MLYFDLPQDQEFNKYMITFTISKEEESRSRDDDDGSNWKQLNHLPSFSHESHYPTIGIKVELLELGSRHGYRVFKKIGEGKVKLYITHARE